MWKTAVSARLQPLVKDHVYTVRRGLAKGLRRRGGLGFLPRLRRKPREEAFLESLDLTGRTVFDIGGFQGVFTLFFARRIGSRGRLVTFEPNPSNHARIVENVRLNGFRNVEVRPIALGADPGRATLVFPPDEAGCGSLLGELQEELRRTTAAVSVEVDVDTLDRQIDSGLPLPDFVKIDVEGFEAQVLDGMRQLIAHRKPTLYIEVHGVDELRKHENAAQVIDRLWRAGYRVHHVESDSPVLARHDIPRAIRGHLYCTAPQIASTLAASR